MLKNLTAPAPASASSGLETLSSSLSNIYLLDIACRDYDFERLRVEVREDGSLRVWQGWHGGGGGQKDTVMLEVGRDGDRNRKRDVSFEVRVLRTRDYYEERFGCMFPSLSSLPLPFSLFPSVPIGQTPVLISTLGFAQVENRPLQPVDWGFIHISMRR